LDNYQRTLVCLKEEYLSNQKGPWIVAWSGGKDSTLLLHAVCEALAEIPAADRCRTIYVLTNDTLVESPFVNNYIKKQEGILRGYFADRSLRMELFKSLPLNKDSYWVNVIGKGYPAPTRHFRWCTDRLKIRPTVRFIKEITETFGHSTLLLGVRRAESSQRAKIAKKYDDVSHLNPHNSLPNCMVFRPILDWKTDDVWEFLAEQSPPWGGDYQDLISLYRDAVGGECPVVIDPDAAPSCGSSSIRFGCWTCTVVQKDKSFRGSIENSDETYAPMADFRDWLKRVSADKQRRMGIRRNGSPGLGPMNLELREEILEKLLKVQSQVSLTLISELELHEIRRIWRVDKVMFDGYFRFREAKHEREVNEQQIQAAQI